MEQYLIDALKIDILEEDLIDISESDNKDVKDLTQKEVVAEAKYILDLFTQGSHVLCEELNSDDPEERSEAKETYNSLKSYIKKYGNDTTNKSNNNKKKQLHKKKEFFNNINVGDKILLNDNDVAEFVKVNRTRFVGIINNVEYTIPIDMIVKKIV